MSNVIWPFCKTNQVLLRSDGLARARILRHEPSWLKWEGRQGGRRQMRDSESVWSGRTSLFKIQSVFPVDGCNNTRNATMHSRFQMFEPALSVQVRALYSDSVSAPSPRREDGRAPHYLTSYQSLHPKTRTALLRRHHLHWSYKPTFPALA